MTSLIPVVSWVDSKKNRAEWVFWSDCFSASLNSLMFLGFLLYITYLLCHALQRILVVGVLELELCIIHVLENQSLSIINSQDRELD